MGTSHRFQATHLRAIARQLLVAAGTPRHIADHVADILVNSDLAGHASHGVLHMPMYLRGILDGRIDPTAEPEVVKENTTVLFIDGRGGFGHYTARKAMNLAIEKAKLVDICSVSLVRTGHMGRLGEYAEAAARAGYIGIITVAGGAKKGQMARPFGGADGALGSNPIAVGVPTGDDTPFIMDFATTMVAESKIQVARSKNADLPEGWIVDKHGAPSVKPTDFYDGGHLLLFGGHKGYALSLLTVLLGGLSGNFDVEKGSMSGPFMQVINVDAFTPLETYQQGVRALLDGIKANPPLPGFDEVLVPGDFERRSRVENLVRGIELPDTIYQQIQEWAVKLNVSLSEESIEATSPDISHTS